MVYLDNAATTRVCPEAAEAAVHMMTECFGNPSTTYKLGREAKAAVDKARGQIAKALGCQPDEVYFTSCGSEGDNWALISGARYMRRRGKHIISSAVEHDAVRKSLDFLEKEGYEITRLQPDGTGAIPLEAVRAALRPDTILVSLMMVNNETGAVQDIAALGKGIKARNSRTHFHVDAVQAWLRMPIDLQKWREVDTLSVSGHKVHAPKGVGALFIRDSQRQTLHPPYVGGHQERGLRPGTENTPYIVGLGVAAAQGQQKLRPRIAHIAALNRQLRAGLEELDGITLNSPDDAVGEIVNFSTGCINSQTFINYLNTRAVYVSGGSACDKGEPSHTLLAMGCSDLTVRTALRVSLCADNTAEDVDALLAGVKDGLKELQHI